MWIYAPKLLWLMLAAEPVTWQLAGKNVVAQAGQSTVLTVRAEIGEGWHLYSLKESAGGPKPTRITVEPPVVLAGRVEAPDALVAEDNNFNIEVEYYVGTVEFGVPVKWPKELPEKVTVRVRYQCCTEKECLPPRTVELTAAVSARAK